ncbi:hypothetical protein [Flavobacterium sp.]|uniref:hypothetical protein n=1 Tax=Flavobacterium sp. TaxID=239 RepID=UPI00261F4F25|nr:hypothetical protein [Flavobacterium sp.]
MNKLKNISTLILLFTTVFFSACSIEPFEGTIPDPNAPVDPVDPALLPTLITTNYSNLTGASATSGGTVTTDGGSAIVARGVVWNTSENPTIANSKTTDGSGTGNFTSSITGLTAGTTYYVRAYATNSSGTGYGTQITFTTTANPANFPVVTTTAISSITSSAASSGGNVTSDGGSPVTARGVVWSTTSGPTTANSKTVDGTGTGTFTSAIAGLAGSTVYYVRAYATNANGTAYGNQVQFTTPAGSVSTGPAMTAKINGVSFQANNPFGTNLYSSTNIWDYYPIADYVMLQGRQGGVLGNPEINLWLKRSDMVVGTYVIGKETFSTPPSHFIDLIDNSNTVSEHTVQGTITITEINTTTKMVKGTFSFTTTDDLFPTVSVVNYTVTDGTFNYKYMD